MADIFEKMEFNGYAEGASELHPASNSTHPDLVCVKAQEFLTVIRSASESSLRLDFCSSDLS